MEIYNNLERFAKSGAVRFFMPGHKGGYNLPPTYLSSVMPYDVTELSATDNLFDPQNVILESQSELSKRFGVMSAHYLTGGATLGLYGALSVCAKPSGYVILDRGCHKSVLDAMILLGLEPVFLDYTYESGGVLSPADAMNVYNTVAKYPDAAAVVITSPSYYGLCTLIEPIHAVTDAAGIPLIVDAAHGGNMLFMNRLPLCAEFTVVSLHKTLPALTGAAVLFSNKYSSAEITRNLALFSTSSPSHIILASAEKSITYMENEGREALFELAQRCAYFTAWLDLSTPFSHIENASSDITRIVIHTGRTTMNGYELYDALEDEFNIICEMADDENVVLIPSVANTKRDFELLQEALLFISNKAKRTKVSEEPMPAPSPVFVSSMREAFFSKKERINVSEADGRTSCETLTKYPPGIPYVMPGQRITEYEIKHMTRLGVEKILVVK